MEVVVTLAVVVLVIAALAVVGARTARGPGERPGPSGDRHPDPEVTDRPAGADAEDGSIEPQRLDAGEDEGESALPSDAAGKPGDGSDDRRQD